jgi:hypothetical protein
VATTQARFATIISRRRSNRSASAPPTPPSAIQGMIWQNDMIASGVAWPVLAKMATPTAKKLTRLPTSDTVWATTSV